MIRFPKERKRIKLQIGSNYKGELDDKGHIYKCWNCGFVCDDRRSFVESFSGEGYLEGDLNIEEYFLNSINGLLSPNVDFDLYPNSSSNGDMYLELTSDDDIKMKFSSFTIEFKGNCPFCGVIFK